MKKRALFCVLISGCGLTSVDLGNGAPGPSRYAVTGYDTTCFVLGEGLVKCAGTNERGQLPLSSTGSTISTCEGLPCTASPQSASLPAFDELVIGLGFGCIRTNRTVTCYGANALGQLARGFTDDGAHPFLPVPIEDLDVIDIVAGKHHVCGLTDEGTVFCWGAGESGALGALPSALEQCVVNDATDAASLDVALGSPVACAKSPRRVAGLDDATRLFAGPFATCAERISGAVVCFGRDDVGQLGTGSVAESGIRAHPKRIGVSNVRTLVLGERHGCALHMSGEVLCFGSHGRGQLGIGPGAPSSCNGEPCSLAPIRPLFSPGVIDLVATDYGTCAVFENGDVACTGLDAFGELGDSDHSAVETCEGEPCHGTPVLMYDSGGQYRADGAGSIVAAGHHLIGRTPSGTFFAWGDNRRRQSGTTGASPITFPGQVYGLDP